MAVVKATVVVGAMGRNNNWNTSGTRAGCKELDDGMKHAVGYYDVHVGENCGKGPGGMNESWYRSLGNGSHGDRVGSGPADGAENDLRMAQVLEGAR
jgi:hypothetical protein